MKDRINQLFNYHNPVGIDPKRFEILRESAKIMADAIYRQGGNREGDKELAFQKLRECLFYAIASVVVPEDQK